MNTPLVSIIIPTFNRVHLIGETLDSVLVQTYTHWECNF
ncbi:MAG: glycosyltransferase [Lutibacter sp.]|nr:glycosyltransferase [Lutibacter sp.]